MEKLTVLLGIFLVITLILWFFLPFAVFGVKDLLQQLINEQKTTNALLKQQQPNQEDKNE